MFPLLFWGILLIFCCAKWREVYHRKDWCYGCGVPCQRQVHLKDKGHIAMVHKQAGMEGLTPSYTIIIIIIIIIIMVQGDKCYTLACAQWGVTTGASATSLVASRVTSSRLQGWTCADLAQILFGVMLQLQQLQPYATSSLKPLPGLLRKAQMCITILSQIFSRDKVKILSECLYVHKKQRRGLCFCGTKAKQTFPELKFSTTGSKK